MPNTARTIKEEVRQLGQRKKPLTYEKMVDIIKDRHPDANTSVKTVQWYASRLRREGALMKIQDGRTIGRPAVNDSHIDYSRPEHNRRNPDDRRARNTGVSNAGR